MKKARECQVQKLIADVCLIAERKALLLRYKDTSDYDGQKGWFLPDDFLRHGEHPEAAARRILKDQAAVAVPRVRLSHIESFEGHGAWHLVFHFAATLETVPAVMPGGNVKVIEWFPLDGLPPADDVAHHGWGLQTIRAVTAPA